jgi:hypothetical protein
VLVGIGASYLFFRSELSSFLSCNPHVASYFGASPVAEAALLSSQESLSTAGGAGETRSRKPHSISEARAGLPTYLQSLPPAIVSQSEDTRLLESGSRYYLTQNESVLRVILSNPTLRELVASGASAGGGEFRDRIVREAMEKMDDHSALARQALEDDPVKARMIALNVSGVAELLKKDEMLREAFLTGDVRQALTRKLASRVVESFHAGSPISFSFLVRHPEHAAYLLANSNLRETLAASDDAAREFTNSARQFADAASSWAARQGGGLLSATSFFTEGEVWSNPRLLALLVGAETSGEEQTLADTINADRPAVDGSIDYSELFVDYHAARARSYFAASGVFTEEFFSEHPGIAVAATISAAFRNVLSASEILFDELIVPKGVQSAGCGMDVALEAYVSGLASRSDRLEYAVSRRA